MGTSNNFLKRSGFLALLMIFGLSCSGEENVPLSMEADEPRTSKIEEILFIGNSLTYYNLGISYHLNLYSANDSLSFKPLIQELAFSGYSLAVHLVNEQTLSKVNERSWDVIILQENTAVAVNDGMATLESIKAFKELVGNKGTIIYLLMPWPYKDQPEMAIPIKKTFEDAAQAIGATIIPVGEVWKAINQEGNPDIDLYDADGLHPSLQGTFFAASMCYSSIYNRNPSENPYTADLENDIALYLKQKAD
jgi:hypothetical protein